MGKMLHNEARELLVESYEKTHNAEEIAKIFGVNKYTVYHCLKQSPVRFCASVNGIASAGLRPMDIACNLGNCYIRNHGSTRHTDWEEYREDSIERVLRKQGGDTIGML